ncbi:subtilase-type protease inhibitor [Kitasatospora mediocidica]|uniref:subtilase-type protease inhibitor n=1 Tax=Kitasatospora mediocidica TaxID=58352 RepID=UPI0005694985|nr:subtilase-type protease inhibitor [Kitasatospora mediocidica]
MRTTRSTFAAVLAAVAVLAVGAGPVSAAGAPAAAPTVPNALVLTVSGAVPQDASIGERAVTLSCRPTPSGDHPDATAACGILIGVQGDFGDLPTAHSFCPDLYLPVLATAQGVWDGRNVSYRKTFTNECDLLRATGQVFDF